jgi:glycolate oxidase FAD binding subunit
MATTTSLRALEAALPADALSEDVRGYAVDGVMPLLVATPSNDDEVASALKAAGTDGAAVIAVGSRHHLGLGMPPSHYDLALDVSRMNRITEYSPADLMVRVEAGVLLSDLQKRLAEDGQWLPLDPHGADGTIGGLLAANRSGPARVAFGSARDLVIGLRVVTAEGEAVKSGGRVVKNVAGYDLAKLHIGAIGTLGVIVEATFKVAPLSAETSTLCLSGKLASLMSTSLQVRNHGLAVNGVTLTGSGEAWRLLLRFAGGSAAVARSHRDAALLAERNGAVVSDEASPVYEGAVVARASLPPASVEAAAASMASKGASVLSYPLTGAVRGFWTAAPAVDDLRQLRIQCRAGGGVLVMEEAPVELKQAFDVWGPAGADMELMRRLKQQFDPNSTLSPGRYVGGL